MGHSHNPHNRGDVRLINLWRKGGRIWIMGDENYIFDQDCAAFVKWCQGNGVKLYTKFPGAAYAPWFETQESYDTFEQQWMRDEHKSVR